jgi:ribonuclease HI
VIELVIEKYKARAFFDGALQGSLSICGACGVIFISDSRNLSLKVSFSNGSNNFVEWNALVVISRLVIEKGIY